MNRRLLSLFAFFIITSTVISGCALSHRALVISLSTDRQTYDLLTDHIIVTLSSTIDASEQYQYQYQITDNGREVAAGTISSGNQVHPEIPLPHTYGPHSISARVRQYNSSTASPGEWRASTPAMVCIWIGGDLPDTYSCPVFGFPEYLEIATGTPSILTITTETPVVTPLIIIRPDNNNGNNNGGSNNPGSATGCAAYSDKNSCDLAGCSWNGSSCTVTP